MTEQGIAQLVTGLFGAAGRNVGEVDCEVYGWVMRDIADITGVDAGRNLWTCVSWERPPSPGLVLGEARRIIRTAQQARPAVEEQTGPYDYEQAKANLARLRALTSNGVKRA